MMVKNPLRNDILCENLCEKNFPKSAKIGKNQKKSGKSYVTISVAYNNFRRLGNPEAVSVNYWVLGLILIELSIWISDEIMHLVVSFA